MKKNITFPENRELGEPLPNATHAVSVSLPKWADIVGYEEGEARVIDALKAGYPRFSLHPIVAKLFAQCTDKFTTDDGQLCIPLPSKIAAIECQKFLADNDGYESKIVQYEPHNIYVVIYPQEAHKKALSFWQHTGYIISSRQAEDILNNNNISSISQQLDKTKIKQEIADLSNQNIDDTYLHQSGMSAIYSAYKVTKEITPNSKTIQLGFPYVDSLKIQEKFGDGFYLINSDDADNLTQIKKLVNEENISAVFCEITGNPELKTIDLINLSKLLRRHNVPLIIDDTLSAWQVDITPYADIIVTSLTKFFSGTGDVLAGSLIINEHSPLHNIIAKIAEDTFEDLLYPKDAEKLSLNCTDFTQRIAEIQQSTLEIVEFFSQSPLIDKIYYPNKITTHNYDAIKRIDTGDGGCGGYGGMFSITFKNPENAKTFYDAVTLCKGPSLGNNFTLLCPYILLAHYFELDTVREQNIDPNLIRISIGLEPIQEIIADFERALSACQ